MSAEQHTATTSQDSSGLQSVDAFWRAANYLAVAQIFLKDNSLLRDPLKHSHIKPRLLGHWGTCLGLSFIYAHVNRAIIKTHIPTLYIAGPGHGGAAINACAFLDGSYSRTYSDFSYDESGVERLVTEFSWPGGSSSHVSPRTPGSIHEGGELGYALAHAFGAVLDNPELVAICVVGDGEAETGPTATSWHANKFLDPQRDGAVLPVLHLNQYKIASPTIFSALSEMELRSLFRGYGYEPISVEGDQTESMHRKMAKALEESYDKIEAIRDRFRNGTDNSRPRWPLIILRTPKGWTGPEFLEGEPVEGSFRSHQVPLPEAGKDVQQLGALEKWLRSYRPDTLFDADGTPSSLVQDNLPARDLRMSFSPHANGGTILRELRLPPWKRYACDAQPSGRNEANPAATLGNFLRDIVSENPNNFRIVSPDETESNRLGAVFETTDRVWLAKPAVGDTDLAPNGRVMEALSEHLCQGWREGYLLTGRHGAFSSYEAFIHIIDSMVNQYAKWIKISKETEWRRPVASLNYLLSSHVWQQDHNGFTHQDPGFLDHLVNKKADIARIYLPPDANTLLSVTDHCLRSRNYVNIIVAGKKDAPCWLNPEEAAEHCDQGMGIFAWASSLQDSDLPEIVLACAGDIPTLETVAAAELLKREAPELRFSVVNVIDLLTLQQPDFHPHGKPDSEFERFFPRDVPVLFAFHGYPWLIHRLVYNRPASSRFDVRGYQEEGSTTTPFDMRVQNQLDRYSLLRGVASNLPHHASANRLEQFTEERLSRHYDYIRAYGEDMPEVDYFTA